MSDRDRPPDRPWENLPIRPPAGLALPGNRPRLSSFRTSGGSVRPLQAKAESKVDLCIVFDTTGSMTPIIDGLVACMTQFVDRLQAFDLDWRVTCLAFGDLQMAHLGDRIEADLPFVDTAEAAKAQLRTMPRFHGGGNEGESSIEAMQAALAKPWRRGAVRIILLLTDEPALDAYRASEVMRQVLAAEMICFGATYNADYYKQWAHRSGGSWTPIGFSVDTSSIEQLLRSLTVRIAKVASDVHTLAGGSVRQYLELGGGGSQDP